MPEGARQEKDGEYQTCTDGESLTPTDIWRQEAPPAVHAFSIPCIAGGRNQHMTAEALAPYFFKFYRNAQLACEFEGAMSVDTASRGRDGSRLHPVK